MSTLSRIFCLILHIYLNNTSAYGFVHHTSRYMLIATSKETTDKWNYLSLFYTGKMYNILRQLETVHIIHIISLSTAANRKSGIIVTSHHIHYAYMYM